VIPANFGEDEFEKAFAEFQRFGPRSRIPIETRWREMFPQYSAARLEEMLILCNEIQSFAIEIAPNVVYSGLADDVALIQISEKFPFLTADQARRTLSQACYFAAK
jgi:hypothetical protein